MKREIRNRVFSFAFSLSLVCLFVILLFSPNLIGQQQQIQLQRFRQLKEQREKADCILRCTFNCYHSLNKYIIKVANAPCTFRL